MDQSGREQAEPKRPNCVGTVGQEDAGVPNHTPWLTEASTASPAEARKMCSLRAQDGT